MAQVLVNNTNLQDIADAIRTKTGGSDTYKPSEMAAAIGDIAGGIVEESSASNMDSYLSTKPLDSVYEYTGTSTSDYINGRLYRIEQILIPIPTVISDLTYTGSAQTGISGYDSTVMTYTGTLSATDAGNYTVTFTLNTGEKWTDGTTAAKSFSWSIAKLSLTIPSTSGTYTYNGSEQTVLVNNFNSTYETAANVAKINADDYTATFSLKDTNNTQWTDSTIADKISDWTIAAKSISGATITLESSSFTYDGTAKTQNVTSVVIDSLTATYTVSDNVQTNAGEYTLTCTGTGNFTGIQTVSWSIAKAVGTLSISPISVSFNNSTLINTVTVTSNCLGTINVSSLSGITSSISGTIVTLTADGSTAISSTMTISVTPDSNHNAPSDVSLSVEASYVTYLTIGGRIFYDNGDNGATYRFFDSSYSEITDTSISGLANAVYYAVSGTPSTDRWYVFDNSTHTVSDGTTTYNVTSGLISSIRWGYYNITTGATTNTIGSGKTNTSTVLAIEDTSSINTNTIWKYVKALNDNSFNDCSDWFIGSEAEQDQLRTVASTIGISWYSSNCIWSSVIRNATQVYSWLYYFNEWSAVENNMEFQCFSMRAF